MPDIPITVLLVEDDAVDRMAFQRLVSTENLPYSCVIATSVEAARQQLASGAFDVIILDYQLGDGTAFDLQETALAGDAPVIMLTGAGDEMAAVNALKVGFADYVVKDLDLNYLFALPRIIERAMHVRQSEAERRRLLAELEHLARVDALTGIANRHTLFEVGEQELSRMRRFGHTLSALMLDIDHFKHVNDTHGHAVGDQVLRNVAQCLRRHTRAVDLVARYGGDEMVVLLVETDLDGARRSGERLRELLAQSAIETAQGPVGVTVSLGVADAHAEGDALDILLGRADAALYAAKQGGRNQIAVSMDILDAPS